MNRIITALALTLRPGADLVALLKRRLLSLATSQVLYAGAAST